MMFFSLTERVLLLLIIPATLEGFIPTKTHHDVSIAPVRQQLQQQLPIPSFSWQGDICQRTWSTHLFMAFDSTIEGSSIFDGHMALTKERDACGVGFIANTQSGGETQNVGTI
jgi:hypothetical protein